MNINNSHEYVLTKFAWWEEELDASQKVSFRLYQINKDRQLL